jgi:uncharacterized membrane protein YkoI
MSIKLKRALIAVAAIAVLGVGGAALAGATGGGDDDATEQPITGSALDKAKAAALEHTGGGTVTTTEVRDEEGYYEVEVKGKGDVHLDRDFNVIHASSDRDGGSEED